MNKFKIYKIHAIADQLQKTKPHNYKLKEIKELCEQIVEEYDNEYMKWYDNSIL